MSREPFQLPNALLSHLADSVVEVLSWNDDVLSLKVVKEIGEEEGLLQFAGISHVNLPPKLQLEGIRVGGIEDVHSYRSSGWLLAPGEHVFVFHGSWGEEFFVIAQVAGYTITN